jgi:hypothetical protein
VSETPQGGGDPGKRINGLVVILLVLVGVMGAWIMFNSLQRFAAAGSRCGRTAGRNGGPAVRYAFRLPRATPSSSAPL